MAEIEYLLIDAETRKIGVPQNLLLGVMEDKDVERVYFKCPKIVGDNINLAEHQIYVKYVSATDNSGEKFENEIPGIYHCVDVTDIGDQIAFSWLLSGNVFKKEGFVAFSVLASDGEVTRWNTTPAIGTVLITIPGGLEEIAEQYPDVINQLLDRMSSVEEMSQEDFQNAVNNYLDQNGIDLAALQEDSDHRTVTDEEKEKWNKSEENVQADWNVSDAEDDAFIKNKPYIPKEVKEAGKLTITYTEPADPAEGEEETVPKSGDTLDGVIGWIIKKVNGAIESIRDLLENKLEKTSVVNNLTTTESGYALDARQGKELKDSFDSLNSNMGKIIRKSVSGINKDSTQNIAELGVITTAGSYVVFIANTGITTANASSAYFIRYSGDVINGVTPIAEGTNGYAPRVNSSGVVTRNTSDQQYVMGFLAIKID